MARGVPPISKGPWESMILSVVLSILGLGLLVIAALTYDTLYRVLLRSPHGKVQEAPTSSQEAVRRTTSEGSTFDPSGVVVHWDSGADVEGSETLQH